MEKPSASDRFSRESVREQFAREKLDPFQERQIRRDIPVLRDTGETTDAPKWAGNHSFSADAAAYSLMHFIEPEVALEHPEWSTQKVKQAAHERFAKRLEQDLSSEQTERMHEHSAVRWHPVETEYGTELATEYGGSLITLRELWEHTKEYAKATDSPQAYNKTEHESQMAMQEKFISGRETAFVSILSDPDGIRYVQVWQKNDDGDFTSSQVDLMALTGRDFTEAEGNELVSHLAVFYRADTKRDEEESGTYAHFYVDRRVIAGDEIQTIAVASVMRRESPVWREDMPQKRVIRNIGKPEERRVSAPDQKPVMVERITTRMKQAMTQEKKEETKRTADMPFIEALLIDHTISVTLLQHVADIPVAAPAVLLWFKKLEATPVVREENLGKEKVRMPKKQEVQEKPFIKKYITPAVRFWHTAKEKVRAMFRMRKSEKKKEVPVKTEQKNILRPVPGIPAVAERVRLRVRCLVRIIKETVLRIFPAPISEKKKPDTVNTEAAVQKRKEMRDEGIRVIYFALWFVFSGKPRKPERAHATQKPQEYVPTTSAESFWILLAVIRYLTLLKESGMPAIVNRTNGTRAVRKKPRRFAPLQSKIYVSFMIE